MCRPGDAGLQRTASGVRRGDSSTQSRLSLGSRLVVKGVSRGLGQAEVVRIMPEPVQ